MKWENKVSFKLGAVMDTDVVARWRVQHHAIAQCIAFGMTDSMICRRTGISHRSLTLMRNDPAFEELVAGYAQRNTESFNENRDPFRDLLYENMMAGEYTVKEHFERAQDSGELVPIGIANKIAQERADRLGYSKHSVVHHEHDFAGALDRAISRSAKVIEAQPVEEPPLHEQPQLVAHPETVVAPQPHPSPEPPSRPPSISEVQRREVLRRRFG